MSSKQPEPASSLRRGGGPRKVETRCWCVRSIRGSRLQPDTWPLKEGGGCNQTAAIPRTHASCMRAHIPK
eukprot:5609640-Pyramimonas_sp.AAC.1